MRRSAVSLGQAFQLSPDSIERLRFVGLMHHIGAIAGSPDTQKHLLAQLDAIEDFSQ